MKILFVSNVPAPYVVAYLNELGKLADVTAVFETGTSTERDKSWEKYDSSNFHCVILKGIRTATDMSFSPSALKFLWSFRKNKIIISNPATPTGILAILFCKLMRIPYILQSEGGFAKDGKGLKEKFKKFLMKDACLYLSGMSLKNEYFLAYGAKPEEVKQYPFTSLHQDQIAKSVATSEEKQQLKDQYGIDGKFIVVYAGRIEDAKGIDILLQACKSLDSGIQVVMIGGEPPRRYLRYVEENHLKNVKFMPFMLSDQLRQYYRMSNVLALPTRGDTWGLVINEGMAQGLPVISTDSCVAAMELIINGENGFIIPTGNSFELAGKINFMFENPPKTEKMAENSLHRIQAYSVENMAEIIASNLKETL